MTGCRLVIYSYACAVQNLGISGFFFSKRKGLRNEKNEIYNYEYHNIPHQILKPRVIEKYFINLIQKLQNFNINENTKF